MGIRSGLFFMIVAAIIFWAVAVFRPPIWVFPVLFVSVFLFYSNTLRERVPLYLSNRKTWMALSNLMNGHDVSGLKRPVFVDLGCGLGGAVAYLAKNHPDWHVVGVETAPGPYLVSKIRVAFQPNASIRFQSLWNIDLKKVNMAYAFLSPVPMARLCQKIRAEMPIGGRFISNSFWPDDEPYDEELWVKDKRQSHLISVVL